MYVRVPCEFGCGDVSISMTDLHVRFCLDTAQASYWFLCPQCGMRTASEVHDDKRVLLLTHPGITPECWSLPSELEETHDGPPISADDLIAFRDALGAA